MANKDAVKAAAEKAGIPYSEADLPKLQKFSDILDDMAESAKEHLSYVADLTKMYKESLRDASAMSEINKIILSDTRLRERIQDQLLDNISKIQSTVNKERLENVKDIITKKKEIEEEKKAIKTKAKEQTDLAKQVKRGDKAWYDFRKDKDAASRLDEMRKVILDKKEDDRSDGEKTALIELQKLKSIGAAATKKDIKNAKEQTEKSFTDFKKSEKAKSKIKQTGLKKELEDAKKLEVQSELALRIEQAALANLKLKPGLYKAVSENATGVLSPLGKILGASGDIKMLFTDFKNPMNAANAAIAATALSMKMFSSLVQVAVQRFKDLEETAEKFRRDTGFTKDQSEKVTEYAKEINKEYAEFGVTLEESTKSVKVLADLFGTTEGITKNTVKDISLMSVNLGLAQEDAAGVLQTFMGISGMTEQSAMNVMKTTAALTNGTKIPFSKVMHDVANASDDVLTSIGATPAKLIKAAVAARAMGLELNKVGSQQKRLLDYSSSITDELEASALLGRNITFMKARQLAFEGKSAESMRETLDVVKQMGNFNAMTPYQRAAVAKAAGMELKDLTKALAVDKARNSILNGTDQKAKDRLDRQDKMLKMLDKESTFSSEELLNQGDAEINTRRMQGMMSDIRNSVNAIAITFGEVFLPAIQMVGGWATSINNTIKDWSSGAKGFLSLIVLGIPIALAALAAGVAKFFIGNIATKFATATVDAAKAAAVEAAKTAVAEAAKTAAAEAAKSPISSAVGYVDEITATPGRTDSRALHKVSGPVSDLAKTEAALPPTGPSGPGSKFAMLMKNINAGITAISMQAIGKFALISVIFIASLVGIAYALKQFQGVDWKTLGVAMVAIGGFMTAAILLGNTVLAGAEGIAAFELALFGLGIALLPVSLAFTVTANAINIARESLVQILEKAEPLKILAFGAAIAGMTFALAASAPVTVSAGAGLLIMSAGLLAFGLAMTVMGDSAEKFGKGMAIGVSALQSLATMNFISLFKNMNKLRTQLKSSTGTFGDFVSGIFGKDTITKIESLSKMSKDITPTATAIATMVESFQNFNAVDNFAKAIGRLATSFVSLNTAVSALDTNKLGEVGKSSGTATNVPPATQTSPATTSTDTKNIVEVLDKKLDEFIKAMSSMTIQMDGNVIGRAAVKYGTRSGTAN